MFKIRSEQIQSFQPDAETAFVRRVADYLKENHPDTAVFLPHMTNEIAKLPDQMLHQIVEGGIKRGGAYGIVWKSTLLAFVVLLFVSAPNFDIFPKASTFLNQTENIDDQAFERFLDEMTDQDWTEVKDRYDPKVWNLPINDGQFQEGATG